MKIKIDEINKKVQIDIKPKDYFICETDEKEADFLGKYNLSHRIDMSYCGKPDQVGSPMIYLDEEDYKKVKGLFDEIC